MSQENIWEKSLSGEIKKSYNPSILVKRNFAYPLTELHLRNYLNTHSINDISLDSLYDYFKENLFKDFNGLYLPHLLCMMNYMPYDKIYKALDEVFQVISPNMGSLNEWNYNYFQFLLLVMKKQQLYYLRNKLKELYELGLKHGLDILYTDSMSNLMTYYYAAIAPFSDILKNYKYFFTPEGVDLNCLPTFNVLYAMEYRFIDNYNAASKGVDGYSNALAEELNKRMNQDIYIELPKYIDNDEIAKCFCLKYCRNSKKNIVVREYEIFKEVEKYIKSYSSKSV